MIICILRKTGQDLDVVKRAIQDEGLALEDKPPEGPEAIEDGNASGDPASPDDERTCSEDEPGVDIAMVVDEAIDGGEVEINFLIHGFIKPH